MKNILAVLLFLSVTLFAKEYDKVTGLVIDKGLDDIKENCTVCHPGRFIVVNGGGKKFWTYKVSVMQKAFGLWDLDQVTHDNIVNYLSKNYAKKKHIGLDK